MVGHLHIVKYKSTLEGGGGGGVRGFFKNNNVNLIKCLHVFIKTVKDQLFVTNLDQHFYIPENSERISLNIKQKYQFKRSTIFFG